MATLDDKLKNLQTSSAEAGKSCCLGVLFFPIAIIMLIGAFSGSCNHDKDSTYSGWEQYK